MKAYDSGLIAWLRGLRDRKPPNEIEKGDVVDERFARMAMDEDLARVVELPDYLRRTNRPYVMLAILTPLGERVLAQHPE